jgi:hypothetical protein
VASYLCQVQTVQRSQGQSVLAAAAYRSASHLVDERLAMEFDFTRKSGVEHAEIILPEGAPAAFRDRAALWNAAELKDVRKDAVPAREVLLALPHELTFQQRRELVRAFVAEHITRHGMIADVAMHEPGKEGDHRNFHAHILVTTRRVAPEGFGKKEPVWWSPQLVRDWRAGWAEIQNDRLRRHLGPDAPQVSHLSLSARGIDREPAEHLGPAATALERRHRRTERGDRNRDARVRNDTAGKLRRDYADTAERLEARAPRVEAPIDKLIAETTRVRDDLVADREAWRRDRDALGKPSVTSPQAVERQLLRDDQRARARAQAELQATEARVERVRRHRLQLVAWIRNPARMIWAKHAELNAIARARKAAREADLRFTFRQSWLRTPQGQAAVSAQRQPALDQAAEAARKRRTLERKIKRMDRRIGTATRTLNDLVVAQELGEKSLRVPAQSPDATRFLKSVGEPARAALQRHPVPARQQAVDRLNRGQGRRLGRSLFPSP